MNKFKRNDIFVSKIDKRITGKIIRLFEHMGKQAIEFHIEGNIYSDAWYLNHFLRDYKLLKSSRQKPTWL